MPQDRPTPLPADCHHTSSTWEQLTDARRAHTADEDGIRAVRQLLNEWDPIGIEPGVEGPEDEYDCLIAPLLARLHQGTDVDSLCAFLREQLAHHFGLDPDASQPRLFAARLVGWHTGAARG